MQAGLGARTRLTVAVGLGKAKLFLLRLLKEYWLCKSSSRELVDEKWTGLRTPGWSVAADGEVSNWGDYC